MTSDSRFVLDTGVLVSAVLLPRSVPRQAVDVAFAHGIVLASKEQCPMPIISVFFGIVIRMFYDDHNPPHIHVEYQGRKALLDFRGNILKGDLQSKTALKLVREWIDLRYVELLDDWELAKQGKEINKIDPLQ